MVGAQRWVQTLTKPRTGLRSKIEEVILIPGDGAFVDRLPESCVRGANVETNPILSAVTEQGKRAYNHDIRAQIRSQSGQCVLRQCILGRQREVVLNACYVLAGYEAKIAVCGQLCVQHLGDGGRDPVFFGLASSIPEPQHGHRTTHLELKGSGWRRSCGAT